MTNEEKKQDIYRRIVKAKLFIDRNFSEDINLKQIAGEACYSKFHFIRLFKRIYGKTPSQYLMSVRIEKAKKLYKTKPTSTGNICRLVGYKSISSFKGLFKRETNLTPTGFKKRHSDLKLAKKKTPSKFIPHCLTKISMHRKNSNFQDTD